MRNEAIVAHVASILVKSGREDFFKLLFRNSPDV